LVIGTSVQLEKNKDWSGGVMEKKGWSNGVMEKKGLE
jgi:hypothetical protein